MVPRPGRVLRRRGRPAVLAAVLFPVLTVVGCGGPRLDDTRLAATLRTQLEHQNVRGDDLRCPDLPAQVGRSVRCTFTVDGQPVDAVATVSTVDGQTVTYEVHTEARRFARNDLEILLIGHAGHEEVEGTTGEAPEHITLVQSPDDVDRLEVRDPSRLAWLSQTTLSVDETLQTVNRLREKFPLLQDPPSDDICYATQNRQLAIKQIAAQSDLVIVVGSANSSNSVRLVEVALEAGAKASYRIDNASEIDPAWLADVDSIGVTSGASVPDDLVRGVLDYLVDQGFPQAREERLTEESLVFALPPELRKDLRQGAIND